MLIEQSFPSVLKPLSRTFWASYTSSTNEINASFSSSTWFADINPNSSLFASLSCVAVIGAPSSSAMVSTFQFFGLLRAANSGSLKSSISSSFDLSPGNYYQDFCGEKFQTNLNVLKVGWYE